MSEFENLKSKRPFGHIILWGSVAVLLVFLLWAYFGSLDEVTEGSGKVIPSRQVQIIQNLEGGIVKKIVVKEGDTVSRGQILMYLDDIEYSSDYNANVKRATQLRVAIARLNALIENKPFDVTPFKGYPERLLLMEQLRYESKKTEMALLQERVALLQKEISMTAPAVKRGSISEVELLRLQQALSELKQKVFTAKSELLSELERNNAEYTKLSEEVNKLEDRLKRTAIRAPVKGIVKQIYVSTEGGVIKAGMPMMEIVPIEDTLLVEVRINPSQIGFITIGQDAKVRITTFDYSIYGDLNGKVEHISADTMQDEDKKSYYEIWVRTDRAYLEKDGKRYRIIPGMQASVSILTGKRSILNYLLQPFYQAKSKALTER